MTWLPWAMVLLRVVLCPAIILCAWRGWAGPWLGFIVLVALVDDILDGMVARRLGCDTPAIRLADSCADTVFYLGVVCALWLREEAVIRDNWRLLAVLGGLELARYGLDFWKFGKGASYHSYLAKTWGLVMAVAVIGVLSFGGLRWMIPVSILVGIAANCEGLAMSLMLPCWINDVKTLRVAWKLRGEMRNSVYASAIDCCECRWCRRRGNGRAGLRILPWIGSDPDS